MRSGSRLPGLQMCRSGRPLVPAGAAGLLSGDKASACAWGSGINIRFLRRTIWCLPPTSPTWTARSGCLSATSPVSRCSISVGGPNPGTSIPGPGEAEARNGGSRPIWCTVRGFWQSGGSVQVRYCFGQHVWVLHGEGWGGRKTHRGEEARDRAGFDPSAAAESRLMPHRVSLETTAQRPGHLCLGPFPILGKACLVGFRRKPMWDAVSQGLSSLF